MAAGGVRVDGRVRDLRQRQLLSALRLTPVHAPGGGRRGPARLARRRAVRATPAGRDLDQAPRAVDPRGRGRLAARDKPVLVLGQPLKEQEVAPLVVDAEKAPRKTDPLEPVLLEYPLRGEIVDQGRRLDAMESELVERVRENLADCAAREPPAVARIVD